jgi:hypothetical protein
MPAVMTFGTKAVPVPNSSTPCVPIRRVCAMQTAPHALYHVGHKVQTHQSLQLCSISTQPPCHHHDDSHHHVGHTTIMVYFIPHMPAPLTASQHICPLRYSCYLCIHASAMVIPLCPAAVGGGSCLGDQAHGTARARHCMHCQYSKHRRHLLPAG